MMMMVCPFPPFPRTVPRKNDSLTRIRFSGILASLLLLSGCLQTPSRVEE